ncbi:MAG: M1 family aminopeptidase, partial [Bacteroidota bacterium]
SQPYGTADWLPVKQLLEDWAEEGVDVSITTAAANKVATVGLLQNTVDVGGGRLRYEYASNYPIIYYLISFAVGEYEEYTITANPTGAAQPIPIQNFLRSASELSIFQNDLDATADMLVFFSDLFGLYPFHEEKYGHVRISAPFSLENQMMSAMATFDRKTLAHELAHQWFGNAVALKSFSHIWLNEGLGTYAEYLYLEEYTTKEVAEAQLVTWINSATSLNNARGRVYVADSLNTADIFNVSLSYRKAAMVWHMMRYLINDDEVFFQAMKDYYNTYQNKNVDTWDMAASFQTSTGIDFTTFLEQWIYGEGYPNYTIEWNWENGQLYIKVDQRASSQATPFFEMPLEFEVTNVNGEKEIFRVIPTANSQLFTLDEATAITELVFDPTISLVAGLKDVQQNPALNGVTSLTPSVNHLVQ